MYVLCMYVRMYVCMHVCTMFIRVFVCKYVCVCMYGWMDGWMDGCTYAWKVLQCVSKPKEKSDRTFSANFPYSLLIWSCLYK